MIILLEANVLSIVPRLLMIALVVMRWIVVVLTVVFLIVVVAVRDILLY